MSTRFGSRILDEFRIAGAPLGLANPTDIAELTVFLASDSARMITGATVSPTGGLTFPS